MSTDKIGQSENIFGKVLREARKALGLTQGEFAKPLSISGSYVSDIEKGKAVPSEAVIREISDYYRINRKKLETGEGEMFREGKGEACAPPPLDEELLVAVLEAVEEYLDQVNGRLKPAKKAQLVAALYDLFYSEEEKAVDKATVIRLVKLAV